MLIKYSHWTDPKYFMRNAIFNAKCENMIWWPPKLESILWVYSEIQVTDLMQVSRDACLFQIFRISTASVFTSYKTNKVQKTELNIFSIQLSIRQHQFLFVHFLTNRISFTMNNSLCNSSDLFLGSVSNNVKASGIL